MPHLCSASLTGRFPALHSPQENQPRGRDLLGVSLGERGGLVGQPLTRGQPTLAALAADPIAGMWGINVTMMLEGLGTIVTAWRGATAFWGYYGDRRGPLCHPPPLQLCWGPCTLPGCKQQLGGDRRR